MRAPLILFCVSLSAGFWACASAPREVRPASSYGAEEPLEEAPKSPPSREERESRTSDDFEVTEALGGSPTKAHPNPQGRASIGRLSPLLGSFYDAVDALVAGERKEPVRILWLGDSHTAADFMTQPVREQLFRLGGAGGPGFVRLGLGGYRHGAVDIKVSGKWRKAPILPAQRTRVLDGVFGYGGIRTLPAAGASVVVTLKERSEDPVVWRLSYRLPKGAQLQVELGEQKEILRRRADADATASEPSDGSGSVVLHGLASEAFRVSHIAGDPQVFGAFVEYEKPGLVLDTVGIDGARAATPLAWEPNQYVSQVRERAPALVVLAFGTNEVFDNTHESRYPAHFEALVSHLREGVEDVPCVIVGPPDSASTQGGTKERVPRITEMQRASAKALGCEFVSAFELMGGEGSFARWQQERPQKARSDRIHLTIAGYEELGARLSAVLFVPASNEPELNAPAPPTPAPLAEEPNVASQTP